MKRFFAFLLAAFFSLCPFVSHASGIGFYPMHDNAVVSESSINELSIRNAISSYMSSRYAFLSDISQTSFSAISAIIADESTHRNSLISNGITLQSSMFTINSIICSDTFAEATVTENIIYEKNNTVEETSIEHNLTVYPTELGQLLVASDAYRAVFSGFTSCSYVDNSTTASTLAIGSRHCIAEVALDEVGYTETGENITKYGSWYGVQTEWCAIFVCWCANQSNISTSVIPLTSGCTQMVNYFINQDNFYSPANISPRTGDIVFFGTSTSLSTHVGIVVQASGSTVYIVDGNSNNSVRYRSISVSTSSILGFARPNYQKSGHTGSSTWYYSNTQHWHKCENCDAVLDSETHTLDDWQSNDNNHWQFCSVCQKNINTTIHTFEERPICKVCTVCGYMVPTAIVTSLNILASNATNTLN